MKILKLIFMVVFLLVVGTASATIMYITEGNIDDYNYTVGSGTIELVDTTSAPDTFSGLSLKLLWPATADNAGIRITDLGDPIINDISGYSYWVYANLNLNPRLTIYLDTDNDEIWDTEARIATTNAGHGAEWFNIDSSGTIEFQIRIPGISSRYYAWADFQAEFVTAKVKQIELSHRGKSLIGGPTTAYLDDFSFGNTNYVFGIPEAATVVLLGLGGLVLIAKKH